LRPTVILLEDTKFGYINMAVAVAVGICLIWFPVTQIKEELTEEKQSNPSYDAIRDRIVDPALVIPSELS
jgi:hypothetical protein